MCQRICFIPVALLVALGWVVCFTGGCGPKVKPTGEVYGKVTVHGKLVTAGTVKFFPEAGDPVGTELAPDGTYRATGVPVGRAKVAIETLPFKNLTPPPPGMAKMMGGPRAAYVPIPAKYEQPDTSGLTFEVEKGKKQNDIDLQ